MTLAAAVRALPAQLATPSRTWMVSAALVALYLAALYALSEPRWASNDDVAMAMVAHGYGLSTEGSSHLVFSSIAWGHLVRAIPDIAGTSGYAVATVLVLFAAGTAVLRSLVGLGVHGVVSALVVALVLVRPALLPQFTVNAGLLVVAAVASWQLYRRDHSRTALVAGAVLAFAGYHVRSLEFALVLGVALPLLPWRAFMQRREARIVLAVLAVAIALSAVADRRAYQGAEWAKFTALDTTRAAYTDFRAHERLRERPEILQRHGYSTNDIDLVGNWFFVDPDIADPRKLRAMLVELGPVPEGEFARANIARGSRIYWDSPVAVFFLTAALLALLRPGWPIAAAWLLCLGAGVAMSLAGRPHLPRVYMPLGFLLLIAPLLADRASAARWRRWAIAAVVAAAAAWYVHGTVKLSRQVATASHAIRAQFAGFPEHPVVVWGGIYPFEALHPVFGEVPGVRRQRLYGLGVMTWVPGSVALHEELRGRGLLARLVSPEGVHLVAEPRQVALLATYCAEHLDGTLQTLSEQAFGAHRLTAVRCTPR